MLDIKLDTGILTVPVSNLVSIKILGNRYTEIELVGLPANATEIVQVYNLRRGNVVILLPYIPNIICHE